MADFLPCHSESHEKARSFKRGVSNKLIPSTLSIIPPNIKLLIVNIYFSYKIFSLDENQKSIENTKIADCLKEHVEAHKTKKPYYRGNFINIIKG